MKILAFTDIHGDRDQVENLKKRAQDADVLVGAGDFTVFEHGLDNIVKKMDEIGKPVIVIHGNHESYTSMRDACKNMKNVKLVHMKPHAVGDVVFLGYGGGGFNFESSRFKEIDKKFRNAMKGKKAIFLIHGPPFDTNLDEIMDDHVGNITTREFIESAKPNLVVCGHIHENFGRHDVVNGSYVINPGPDGKIVEV